MTARFLPPSHPGGRILLRSGSVDVGAVFPPAGEGQHRYPWVWRFWGHGGTNCDGRAKTDLAARTALMTAWRDHLRAAALTETHDEDPADV